MYPALEQYPKSGRQVEQVYETVSVRNRIQKIGFEAGRRSLPAKEFSSHAGITYKKAEELFSGKGTLMLDKYLTIAKLFQWDISHDVNYAYAMVKYSPEDILRRLNRLFDDAGVLMARYILILSGTGKSNYAAVLKSLKYEPDRTLKDYARGMLELSRIEKIAGYPDALDFEE